MTAADHIQTFGRAHVTSERFLSALIGIAEFHFEQQDITRDETEWGLRAFAAISLRRAGKHGRKLDVPNDVDAWMAEPDVKAILDPIVSEAMRRGGWDGTA